MRVRNLKLPLNREWKCVEQPTPSSLEPSQMRIWLDVKTRERSCTLESRNGLFFFFFWIKGANMIWKWCSFPFPVFYLKKNQLLKNSVLGLRKQRIGFHYALWESKILVTCTLSARCLYVTLPLGCLISISNSKVKLLITPQPTNDLLSPFFSNPFSWLFKQRF